MSPAGAFDGIVQKVLDGEAPLQLRQVAARGALPLPRTELVRLFLHLRGDPDEQVRAQAQESLAALSPEAIEEILGDPVCAQEILRHFAPLAVRDVSLAERVVFHPRAPVAALATLAAAGSPAVLDLVLTNQERLLRSPDLLNHLSLNPALRADQRGRVLDILERLSKETRGTSPDGGPSAAIPEEASPAEAARLLEVEVGDLLAASEILGGEEFEQAEDPEIRTAYRRILGLSPMQKAMLAMKGGRSERMILVRDTNRVVALSVLRNARMTEQDVEEIARLRNVCEEVLRTLGTTREWAGRYPVMAALARNPRTPQGIGLNFVSRLTVHDLKDLARDRNVPDLIRRMAKKTYDLRTQKAAPLLRKK